LGGHPENELAGVDEREVEEEAEVGLERAF